MTETTIRSHHGVDLPAPGTFVLDKAHTRIGFVAKHLMVAKVRGQFTDFAGSVTVADNPVDSTAEGTVQVASITTGSPDRDAHLRSGDFFDIETYPVMTFTGARVVGMSGATFRVVGDLTIKGITRQVEFDVEFDGVARDPWGGERIALTATTEIDREDFGMTWNVALESGGVLVGRKVKLEIEAEAVRQV
jgi:polyisoprenoid-binding protein YceI